MSIKFNMILPEGYYKTLKRAAKSEETTMTEIIKKSLIMNPWFYGWYKRVKNEEGGEE